MLIIFVSICGAFLAPIFLSKGAVLPAAVLYNLYAMTCHQFAYRSWFLFGEQRIYPLEVAGIPTVASYEDISGNDASDYKAAKAFIGDAIYGYKVALCQRDIAIYSGILLSCAGFGITKRKWLPISVPLYIVLGILPIFMDGITQLAGGAVPILNLLPTRESNPIMRTMTGLLFGITTGLYLFPKLESALNILKNNYRCEEN